MLLTPVFKNTAIIRMDGIIRGNRFAPYRTYWATRQKINGTRTKVFFFII